ncbi:MAG: hypothetical protein QOE34_1919 [Verrucomicrobiota bacterium]|jgi:anti-sigma factor RsiW
MKREDDEKLWDLLGRAAEPEVSPFFARNVVRETRRQAGGWPALPAWFGLRRLLPAAGVGVALIAVVFLKSQTSVPRAVETEPDKLAIISAQDYEVIADLDDLLASDDNNSLEESVLL